jgi:23S rRNA pseudouridine2605 synthase
MRLNRFLASCGLGSRRGCESIIAEGRVTINGRKCGKLATQVEPGDAVKVDGRLLAPPSEIVVVFNKPAGYVCSQSDERGRPTIYDLLPGKFRNLHHVGRLDMESEGLLVLTNSGDLTQQILHPSHKIPKEYLVTLDSPPEAETLERMVKPGVHLPEGLAKAVMVKRISPRRIRVVLEQGLKRQIRQMFEHFDHRVKRLIRFRIGGVEIEGLKPGKCRVLEPHDLKRLLQTKHKR